MRLFPVVGQSKERSSCTPEIVERAEPTLACDSLVAKRDTDASVGPDVTSHWTTKLSSCQPMDSITRMTGVGCTSEPCKMHSGILQGNTSWHMRWATNGKRLVGSRFVVGDKAISSGELAAMFRPWNSSGSGTGIADMLGDGSGHHVFAGPKAGCNIS